MARELELQITAETSQADQALARVEAELGKVESAAGKADTALDKNAKTLRDTGKAAGEASEGTKNLIALIQKYAGPAVIVEATRRSLAFADSIQEMAAQTGASIKGVQQLGFVAERAGSSFQQVANAISQMDNRLAKGDKAASTAIRNIGLSVDGLLKMKPDERFIEIAKAIGGIEDPAKRTQAAMAVFGRTGADLVPVMRDIANGAHEAAFVLSDEFVNAASGAQDELDKLMQTGKTVLGYFLTWPAVLGKWAGEVGLSIRRGFATAWQGAKELIVGGVPLPAPPGSPGSVAGQIGQNGALPVPGLPANMGSIERELAVALRENTRATDRNSTAMGAPAGPLGSSALPGMGGNAPFNGNGWGMFRPGVGMQPPSLWNGVLPSNPLFDLANPATWNGTGAGMFRTPVQSNMPGAQGGGGVGGFFRNLFGGGGNKAGGGGFFSNLFQNGWSKSTAGAGLMNAGFNLFNAFQAKGQDKYKAVGSTVGSTAGMAFGPVGSLVGGWLGGKIGGAFYKEGQKVNDTRDDFTAAAGGIDMLAKKAADAGKTLEKFYKAKTLKEFEAAVRDLNSAFADQEADQERLRAAAERYGFELKDMGQAFKQGEVTKGFKEMGEDFRVLINSGIDFNKVAEKMAPEFGSLIHTAIETGTTVPRELEPILKKMIEMGVLTDKNGDKFTDLAQIPFAESMTEGFDKVVKAIGKLTDILANDLPEAARRGAAGVNRAWNDIQTPNVGNPGGDPNTDPVNVARGGVIQGPGRVLYFAKGGFVPIGSDTVPAMLTPGEMVIPRDTARELAPYMPKIIEGGIGDLIRGGTPVFDKGETPVAAPPEVRSDFRMPGAGDVRPQPVPFERGGGDVVLISVPDANDPDALVDAVEKQLSRSIPGNRNRLRDMLDQLYQRRSRKVA